MHSDDVGPVRPAHLVKDLVAQDAGIVDEDVDPAEGFARQFDDVFSIFWLGNRESRRDRLAAGFFYGFNCLLRGASVAAFTLQARANIADDDARTLIRKQ